MFNRLKNTLGASLILLLTPIVAFAHPHILINSEVQFNLIQDENGNKQLKSLYYSWQFDENFSLLLLGDYDDDQNQLLSQEELNVMGIETMEGAKELKYFTQISTAAKQIIPEDAPEVRATFADNRLTLAFNLSLPNPIAIDSDFAFSLYDEEYYTAFDFSLTAGYIINGANTENCKTTSVKQGQVDTNIQIALENAFTDDMTNQGFGAQFADKIGIKCAS